MTYDQFLNSLTGDDEKYKKVLGQLHEFDFKDFKRNLELSKKCNGDINLILTELTKPVEEKPVPAMPQQ